MTWSEQYLYGSSRLGSVEPDVTWHNGNDLNDTPYFSDQEKLCIGWKRYEISNHLGNIMAVLNDRKYYKDTDADDEAEYFDPVFMAATDYYPFGYEMPGRKYNFGDYRYGFNGKENDSDGEFSSLTHYDYGFRIYNPAIGRFLSVDPLTREYPWYTPYQFAGNMPILAVDLDGLEPQPMIFKDKRSDRGRAVFVRVREEDVERARPYLHESGIRIGLNIIDRPPVGVNNWAVEEQFFIFSNWIYGEPLPKAKSLGIGPIQPLVTEPIPTLSFSPFYEGPKLELEYVDVTGGSDDFPDPYFRGEVIPPTGEPFSFSELVATGLYNPKLRNPEEARSQIDDLAAFLNKNDDASVLILGNFHLNSGGPKRPWSTKYSPAIKIEKGIPDHINTWGDFAVDRARQVEKLLIDDFGVNPKQLTVGIGDQYRRSLEGQSISFTLKREKD